jgi:hypothetical protein
MGMKLRAQLSMAGFNVSSIVDSARNDFKEVVFDSCMRIETAAKQRCTVDTGQLRGDIKTRFTSDGTLGSVGTDVNHGPFVEFGTGRRGASSGVTIPDGIDYQYGSKAGMIAQPFLFPSLEEERPTYEQALKGVLRNLGTR